MKHELERMKISRWSKYEGRPHRMGLRNIVHMCWHFSQSYLFGTIDRKGDKRVREKGESIIESRKDVKQFKERGKLRKKIVIEREIERERERGKAKKRKRVRKKREETNVKWQFKRFTRKWSHFKSNKPYPTTVKIFPLLHSWAKLLRAFAAQNIFLTNLNCKKF